MHQKALCCMGLCLSLLLSSCGDSRKVEAHLDPNHPVTVVLWNYYNGQTKAAFDDLVSAFNETVGMQEGIVVDTVSHGDIQQLATAVYHAAAETLGAEEMPNIFGGYPDNVFRIDQLGAVADLGQYFTQDELARYRQDFLTDCYMGEDGSLKVIPAARSTEILYLNKTDWDRFHQATGADLDALATWEGVAQVAEEYYHWTDSLTETPGDGKAFLGVDSFASFTIAASMQLEQDIYRTEGGTVSFSFHKDLAQRIWDGLYVPYLNGYFANNGSFRSDDEKTGEVLAYIGSSAGAQYFPTEVTVDGGTPYPVEGITLPYPCFEGGKPYAIAQGAGFAVAKSDPTREYASAVFLKWFTDPAQNVKFAVASGYLPVQNEALSLDLVAEAQQYNAQDTAAPIVAHSIETTQKMLRGYTLYANPSFQGSYDLRGLFNHSLLDQLPIDLQEIATAVQSGTTRKDAVAERAAEAHFTSWYEQVLSQADELLIQ